jgi:F0F1-type ATP synthase assembly protein I
MTDGITTGLGHALWLLGYLIGLAPLYVVVGLVLGLAAPAAAWITHRVRVHRIRRQARHTGRSRA